MPKHMDRVVDVTEVVAREIAENVALGVHDADSYFLRDEAKRTYSFVAVPHERPQRLAQFGEYSLGARAILDSCRMNDDFQQIADGIH
ncbi:MAG: hypothetical protein ACYDBJ_22135 [Aggregatilineales bacterium]